MIFHDVKQNGDEWDALRVSRITGSAVCKAMANFGKAFGEPAKKYATNIAVEQITGCPSGDSFSNEHTERGHEEEPLAIMEYENSFFCDVSNGGFFEDGDLGCSPDGLVCNDGLIETKAHIPSIHYANIVRGSYNPAYKWQYAFNLKLTKRDWIDTMSYCKTFPEGKRLYVCRCTKYDFKNEFEMIDVRIEQFRKLIEETKERILNSNYFTEAK